MTTIQKTKTDYPTLDKVLPKRLCKDCGEEVASVRGRCRECHKKFRRKFKPGERTRPQLPGEIESAPFVDWLKEYIKKPQFQSPFCRAAKYPGIELAAHELDTDVRHLFRWLDTPSKYVRETTVDNFFVRAGQPGLLRELYPELYMSKIEKYYRADQAFRDKCAELRIHYMNQGYSKDRAEAMADADSDVVVLRNKRLEHLIEYEVEKQEREDKILAYYEQQVEFSNWLTSTREPSKEQAEKWIVPPKGKT